MPSMMQLMQKLSEIEVPMTTHAALRPLHSDADYETALAEYEGYFDKEPRPGTEAADRFEVLGLLLAKYEESHCAPAWTSANGRSQMSLMETSVLFGYAHGQPGAWEAIC